MTFDAETFIHHLEDYDLSTAQKVALIHSVSDIMKGAVDQAWGRDPVQMSLASRNKDDSVTRSKPVESSSMELCGAFGSAADKAEGAQDS